jgi:hypothetical protein
VLLSPRPPCAGARAKSRPEPGDSRDEFLGLNHPYAVLAFPFDTDFGPVYNMWALGLCLVAVAWLARRDPGAARPLPDLRRRQPQVALIPC